jgi:hypothetical protein
MCKQRKTSKTKDSCKDHSFSPSACNDLCAPGMGVNLWGESPLNVNPVNVLNILTKVLAEGKGGIVRFCLKEAEVQSYEPTNPAWRDIQGQVSW